MEQSNQSKRKTKKTKSMRSADRMRLSTSAMALAKVQKRGTATKVKFKILDSLAANPGQSRLELSDVLGVPINSITAPVLNLIKSGRIIESEEKINEKTGSKAWALILRPSDSV